jgi:hypothetical protein
MPANTILQEDLMGQLLQERIHVDEEEGPSAYRKRNHCSTQERNEEAAMGGVGQ